MIERGIQACRDNKSNKSDDDVDDDDDGYCDRGCYYMYSQQCCSNQHVSCSTGYDVVARLAGARPKTMYTLS